MTDTRGIRANISEKSLRMRSFARLVISPFLFLLSLSFQYCSYGSSDLVVTLTSLYLSSGTTRDGYRGGLLFGTDLAMERVRRRRRCAACTPRVEELDFIENPRSKGACSDVGLLCSFPARHCIKKKARKHLR